jgi:two-component system chemotaxis response regulator CheB
MTRRRVLVVDDSLAVRQVLTHILNQHPELEVVGQCADPYEAREKVIALQPDVLTLDVEMPRMDGLTFLSKLMKARPTPVVMISSLTAKGTEVALEALHLGAIDVVGKNALNPISGLERMGGQLGDLVYAASLARFRAPAPPRAAASSHPITARPGTCIAIGSSTGGTEALREVFTSLPTGLPPIFVVQHMMPGFTGPFAERLNKQCAPTILEAADGLVAQTGHIYIAPADQHLRVQSRGGRWQLELLDTERVNRHRPSVDVLMHSVAAAGSKALGIILTGMGDDGAEGLLAMRQAGARTLVQDEATCVVFGMPRVAWQRGAAERQVALPNIAGAILDWIQE